MKRILSQLSFNDDNVLLSLLLFVLFESEGFKIGSPEFDLGLVLFGVLFEIFEIYDTLVRNDELILLPCLDSKNFTGTKSNSPFLF